VNEVVGALDNNRCMQWCEMSEVPERESDRSIAELCASYFGSHLIDRGLNMNLAWSTKLIKNQVEDASKECYC